MYKTVNYSYYHSIDSDINVLILILIRTMNEFNVETCIYISLTFIYVIEFKKSIWETKFEKDKRNDFK